MLHFTISSYGNRHGVTQEDLGFIPAFFSEHDLRPAREQLDMNYQHGGGWRPLKGWKAHPGGEIEYPGDEPLKPIAEASLHGGICEPGSTGEMILIYESAWVQIVQADGSFEIGRVD